MSALNFPVWCNPEGQPVACVEKIKVMHENLEELRQMAQDALEDAILMGCDEAQVRAVLGLEPGLVPLAMLSLGYPAELPEPSTRRRLDEVVTWR